MQETYSRLLARRGRRVSLRRSVPNGPAVLVSNVRARIAGYEGVQVSAAIQAGERRVLILAEDVPPAFRPLRQNDRIEFDNLSLVFTERPDDQKHRDGEMLLAYEGRASGA